VLLGGRLIHKVWQFGQTSSLVKVPKRATASERGAEPLLCIDRSLRLRPGRREPGMDDGLERQRAPPTGSCVVGTVDMLHVILWQVSCRDRFGSAVITALLQHGFERIVLESCLAYSDRCARRKDCRGRHTKVIDKVRSHTPPRVYRVPLAALRARTTVADSLEQPR